jgi:Na+/phosphate symporter
MRQSVYEVVCVEEFNLQAAYLLLLIASMFAGWFIRLGRDRETYITRKEFQETLLKYASVEHVNGLRIEVKHLNENIQGLRDDLRSGLFLPAQTAREIIKS